MQKLTHASHGPKKTPLLSVAMRGESDDLVHVGERKNALIISIFLWDAFLLTISAILSRCSGQNAYGPHDAAFLIMVTVLLMGLISLNGPHGNILRAALPRGITAKRTASSVAE